MPCLRRSTGDGPATSPPPGAFGDAPVDGDVVEQQPDDAVVGLAGDPGQLGEHPESDPLVAAVPDGGRRAGGVGDRLVGAAEPQHLDQLVEHDPIRDPAAVTAPRMSGDIGRSWRQQRGELVPQGVDKPRWQSGHAASTRSRSVSNFMIGRPRARSVFSHTVRDLLVINPRDL